MYTIVGLGNPGEEYKNTRHNIGWIILERIITEQNFPTIVSSSKYAALFAEGQLFDTEVGIVLPNTYMNNSGTAVQKYLKEHPSELVVVHDDVDLPLGEIKISYDRGAGGHNGVKSIIETLKTQKFIRIRIGVARKGFFGGIKRPSGDKLADFVLKDFSKSEENQFPDITLRVCTALEHIFKEGVAYAMQEGNRKE